ncbi:MAG: Trk system potassium transporter TrkA [Acidimicrobiales bacterium]|nr:Trk system potassium transporter TrkA [Acidimicrobiales bacterium]
MHIIVVGAGEVGSYVAEFLSREGNDVAVVETDAEQLRVVGEQLDVLTVAGSGSHPHVLRAAGIERADLLVAVTSNDEANLVACLLAQQAGVAQRIVRLEADCFRSREAKGLMEGVGADLVIDPDAETAKDILELLEYPGATDLAVMGGGEVVVLGTILSPDAPLCGRTLSDIAAEYEPDWYFIVAALTRGEHTVIPRADVRLEANDHLWVLCKRSSRRDLMKLLGLDRGTSRRVMLLGGGHTAQLVAQQLAVRHCSVTLVERDHARALELAECLDGVLVLEGDITDAELLAMEDVGRFDAVVALTGQDDANILACLYAKSLGAKETIAVLHRLQLRGLLEEVGIDVALSPRTATANAVLRFVRGGVAAVATFLAADFEVIELEVAKGSAADGTRIRELGLPKEVLVGAFVRDGKPQIGRGRSELRNRDHVVIFSRPESLAEVRALFS